VRSVAPYLAEMVEADAASASLADGDRRAIVGQALLAGAI